MLRKRLGLLTCLVCLGCGPPNTGTDAGEPRLVLFDSAGTRLGVVGRGGAGPAIRLYRVPGHEFYTLAMRAAGGRRELSFVRHTAAGAQDTLARPPRPELARTGVMCEGSDKGLHFFSSPWGVSYLEHPGPSGTILTATTDAYRIVQRNPRGDTIAVFRGTTTTLPFADVEWDSATVELSNYLARDAALCAAVPLTGLTRQVSSRRRHVLSE